MDLKTKKESLRKSIAGAKKVTEQIKEVNEKRAKDKEALAKKFNEINKSMTIKGVTMNKNFKSDAFLVKALSAITGKPQEELLQKYAVEKTMELTTDHTNIANNVKSSDLILEFDARDAELSFINRFTKVDMSGKAKLEIPVESEDFVIQHVAEGADSPEATWDESTIELKTSRAALTFNMSKELVNKSIVDQLSYVRNKISLAVGRGSLELVYNGQGANAAQKDTGYSATATGIKGPGIRATLSAAGKTFDFAAAAVSRTNMANMLKSAGQLFAQKQSEFVMILALRSHQGISDLVRGNGVTGVNDTQADSSLYASKFMNIELHQTAFLKSPIASGSGYDETGFVSSTGANNDHEVILLIRPSRVLWALDSLEVSSEYKPRKASYEVTVDCQLGVAFQPDLGIMGINVGADI